MGAPGRGAVRPPVHARRVFVWAKALVDAAMPPRTRGLFHAREIWIDDALCRAARRRRVALRQRRVAAFVIGGRAVHVQATRISRIVRLTPRRPYYDPPNFQIPHSP